MKYMEEVCKKYELQVRGTHGEHSEAVEGIYDISNSRRLGMTREALISDLVSGIVTLAKEE